MTIRHRLGVFCTVLWLATMSVTELPAAILTVTSADDSGPGSLRHAIDSAAAGDEIRFDPALDGVPIQFSSSALFIHRDLTITGRGAQTTTIVYTGTREDVDYRCVLDIDSGIAVTIQGMSLKAVIDHLPCAVGNDGHLQLIDSAVEEFYLTYGTLIFNRGELTLLRTVLRRNSADQSHGGITNEGTVHIQESRFEQNYRAGSQESGGGLNNYGTATIVDSIFRDNLCGGSSTEGGSILNWGVLRISRTNISGNVTAGSGEISNHGIIEIRDCLIDGNEIAYGGSHGGVMLNWGDAVILNTTFHGNVSWKGRGALESYGKLRVVASTFTDNFGYEYSAVGGGGESVFRNNLIVGNHVVDQVPDACGGAFVSQGGNIVGGIEDTCWSFVDGYKGDGVGMQLEEVVESFENPAWPYLGMRKALLNDNGGPTPTVALLPDSPAIDAIASGACVDDQGNALLTDQRGVLRPQGAACDVGAFELSLPRGLGFWAHQCSDKNFKQISSVELQALFDEVAQRSVVFPECAPIECGALEPQTPRGDMRKRAEQHLLGAWLNLVSGRLTMGRPIELAGSTGSTTVGEALDEMEAVVCDPTATRGELERVKDIAEALNGNGEDMELVALEPNLTVRPGEARLVTLGLVNMSQDHRNYQLHVTGPWPTRVSTTRVNGLGSGQAALLTATVVAPLDAGGQTGRISISATDLQSAASLEREAIIKVRVVDNTPSKDPGGRLPRIE